MVVSIYYIHILKFLQFFPREQFLFVKMEDMVKQPIAFIHHVTDFLEIQPYPVREIRDALERKHNRQKAGIGKMHEDTRQLLHDFFTPYNRQLARLLDDDRFPLGILVTFSLFIIMKQHIFLLYVTALPKITKFTIFILTHTCVLQLLLVRLSDVCHSKLQLRTQYWQIYTLNAGIENTHTTH